MRTPWSIPILAGACSAGTNDAATDGPAASLPPDARELDAAPAATDGPPAPAGDVVCPPVNGRVMVGLSAVRPADAIPAGRLAVTFRQLVDEVHPWPGQAIGLDVPIPALAAGETRCVALDLAAIVAPGADGFQLCDRACYDLADPACKCRSPGPRIGVGFVVAARDRDGNGRLDPGELGTSGHGAGWFLIGAAPAAHAPGAPMSVIDFIFPMGTEAGVRPYGISSNPAGYDRLVPVAPGATLQLRLCPPDDETCALPYPELT